MVMNLTRKIVESDVNELAKLVAQRKLTETEACQILDIKPDRWFRWKQRNKNKERFDILYSRMRAIKISNCLQKIDECGDGIGLKQPDWRAKAWLAERLAPDRFSQIQTPAPATTNNVSITIAESIRRAYSADTGTLMKQIGTKDVSSIKMDSSPILDPANGIVETRKLPPKRKGEAR